MCRRQIFVLIASFILLTSCSHHFKAVRFSDGLTLQGKYNKWSSNVSIIMPDGEVMQGQYVAVSNAAFSMGFGAVGGKTFATYGAAIGGSGNAYALLTGDRGTVMEIVIQFNPLSDHGFGEGRTNRGEQYKIIF